MRQIPHKITKWLTSFLTGRSTQLRFNSETSDPFPTKAGVPQGSPLSPILYMYYNADLLDKVKPQPGELALGFIDDVVYGVSGT